MELKHEPDSLIPEAGQVIVTEPENIRPLVEYSPRSWSVQGSDNVKKGALPSPGSADDRNYLTFANIQRTASEHNKAAVAILTGDKRLCHRIE